MTEAKPYQIPKHLVWEAWKQVKANRGAAGVDGVSIEEFEKDLKRNLQGLDRMSSGTYCPPPVRLVEIPKANGGKRPLGIPSIADRVAQTVDGYEANDGTNIPSRLLRLSARPLGA